MLEVATNLVVNGLQVMCKSASLTPQIPQMYASKKILVPSLAFWQNEFMLSWQTLRPANYNNSFCDLVSLGAVVAANHCVGQKAQRERRDFTAGLFQLRAYYNAPILGINMGPHCTCLMLAETNGEVQYLIWEPQNHEFKTLNLRDALIHIDIYDIIL